jgi:hypothetical protein
VAPLAIPHFAGELAITPEAGLKATLISQKPLYSSFFDSAF